eukprot:g8516.t1
MQPDRAALAQRIQGFGNVNPPPLEDENASSVAKRAVRNLGDMVGEEVALTVQDFKEKGAVGAVKDAVLANGPRGAAYGVSQASPTGGINAVWVMPEEADPATLAELAAKSSKTGNPAYATRRD